MSEKKDQETILNKEGDTTEEVTFSQENEINQESKEVLLWKDQCKRISAEFENYKKRTERDLARWSQAAKEAILIDLLVIVEDFDRALQQEKTDNSGIGMLYQSFIKLLEKYGVKIIETYDMFDPHLHEAVMQVESDTHTSGQIVDVFSKGFMLQDRILRPAKVSVAK